MLYSHADEMHEVGLGGEGAVARFRHVARLGRIDLRVEGCVSLAACWAQAALLARSPSRPEGVTVECRATERGVDLCQTRPAPPSRHRPARSASHLIDWRE